MPRIKRNASRLPWIVSGIFYTIVFAKLLGLLSWSWAAVLAPVLIPFGFVGLVLVCILAILIIIFFIIGVVCAIGRCGNGAPEISED